MEIDWFTFGAQIVNFLILVALLKRFLYGPIIRAMQRREEKIAARLNEADEKLTEAETEVDRYRRKNEELDQKRDEILREARAEADKLSKQLADGARQEVKQLREEWHETLRREQDAFLDELRSRAGRQSYFVARRALRELADEDLERRMVGQFVERLEETDHGLRNDIAASLRRSGQQAVVSSSFELPGEAREQIREAMRQLFDAQADVTFETSADVIAGIELKAAGRKVAWSFGEYLTTLEQSFDETLRNGVSQRD